MKEHSLLANKRLRMAGTKRALWMDFKVYLKHMKASLDRLENINEEEKSNIEYVIKNFDVEKVCMVDIYIENFMGNLVVVFAIAYEGEIIELYYHSNIFFDVVKRYSSKDNYGQKAAFTINEVYEVMKINGYGIIDFNEKEHYYCVEKKEELSLEEMLHVVFYYGSFTKKTPLSVVVLVEFIRAYYENKLLFDGLKNEMRELLITCKYILIENSFVITLKQGGNVNIILEEEWF